MARSARKHPAAGAGRTKKSPKLTQRAEEIREAGAAVEAVAAVRDTFKVNVDFPLDLLRRIDAEADRIGIARQAWIKMRLADLIDATRKARESNTSGNANENREALATPA